MKKIIDFLSNPIFNIVLGLFGLVSVYSLISLYGIEFHFESSFCSFFIYVFSSNIGYGLGCILKKKKKSGKNPDNNI